MAAAEKRRTALVDHDSAEALLKRLEWTVLRRLDGLLQGDHRTLMRGAGLDLADLREYQHHDDVRHIDWNVTARLQTPYVRQFTEDRELSAWFLVDLSASVDFGSDRFTKRTVAREFVAVLARLLTRHGNRVGALLYGNSVDTVLPARGGRVHVLDLLQRMAARPAESAGGATDLRELLLAAQRTIKRRSTLFIVSDFVSAPGWERALGQLAQRHEVTAVRLFDPLEMDLPDIGLVTMKDAETGEQIVVDTHNRRFRERFAGRGREARDAAARIARPRRRRHPRARHRRRPRRRGAALRRPEEAAQPARQLDRADEPLDRPRAAGRHGAGAEPAMNAATPWMTFLWPTMLWAMLALPVIVALYVLPDHAAQEDEPALRQPRPGQGSARQPQRLAPPRAAGAALPGAGGAAVRVVAAGGADHAAVGAGDDRPGDGRLGQHARRRRPAEPARRRAGSGQGLRRRPAEQRARSRSSRSPAPRRSCRRRRSAATTSTRRSTASSCSAAPRSAAASSSRWRRSSRKPASTCSQITGARAMPPGPNDKPPPEFKPVAPGSYSSAAIILLTDGQRTTGPDSLEAAKMAADRGVRIYTVGIGTKEGETIGFEGWSMRVRLDEETLKAVAKLTNADYFYAGTAQDLKKVYQGLSTRLIVEKKETEISALLAVIGALARDPRRGPLGVVVRADRLAPARNVC